MCSSDLMKSHAAPKAARKPPAACTPIIPSMTANARARPILRNFKPDLAAIPSPLTTRSWTRAASSANKTIDLDLLAREDNRTGCTLPSAERMRSATHSPPPTSVIDCSWYQPASGPAPRSEEHTSELQSLMRISYAVFCLKKKTTKKHKQ